MAAVKVVEAAAAYPVTLEEAKAHLRVDFDDDDDLIEALIGAATEYAERFQGRALIEQTLDIYFDAFPIEGALELPKPPTIEIEGVFYRDSGNSEIEYTGFLADTSSQPARIYLSSGAWPGTFTGPNAVRVRVRAGYVDDSSPPAADVPQATIAAIKLIIGSLYGNRESMTAVSVTELSWGAEQLLRMNRVELGFA